MQTPKNIVVLGAGFGGLRAALRIHAILKTNGLHRDYHVVIIDRYSYHTFTPLLYEIASTSDRIAGYRQLKSIVTFPIKKIFERTNVQVLTESIETIDPSACTVRLSTQTIPYAYLILAMGSETQYVNLPRLKETALSLKTFESAIRIRDRVLEEVDRGNVNPRIVIVGGGPTGIELAAELRAWVCQLGEDMHQKCAAEITIVDRSPAVLVNFDPRVSLYASRRLAHIGVRVRSGESIAVIEPHLLTLSSGATLPFDIFIWAGGTCAPTVSGLQLFKQEARGRMEVYDTLCCIPQSATLKTRDRMYAIGDIACMYDPTTKKPVPQVARAAIDQGTIVAQNIMEEIKKERDPSYFPRFHSYKPKEYPYVVAVGGKYAIAKLGNYVIHGILAWPLKGLIELRYLLSIMPLRNALAAWLEGLIIFIRNDRLG